MNAPPPIDDTPWATLGMLARAVAGRDLIVAPAQTGHTTHSTGREILLTKGLLPDEQRQAVITQALLLAADSLSEPTLKRLIGRSDAAQRYMSWELARALALFGDRLPSRIEHHLRGLTDSPPPLSKAASQSVDWALTNSPRRAPAPLPKHLGQVRPGSLTWQRLKGNPALQTATLRHDDVSTHQIEDQEDPLANKLLKMFSSPLGGGSLSSLLLKLMGFGASASGNTTPTDDNGVAVSLGGEHQMTGAPPDHAEQLKAPATDKLRASTPPPTRWRYPEWFDSIGRFKPDWVHVHEFVPPLSSLPERRSPHPQGAMIRSQMAKVGVEFQRHRAQADGQDFDLDALILHAVEGRHSGTAPRLYQASRRTRRDLTLLILLDISNSTGDHNAEGQRIIDQQKRMAREITRASARLGDQVGLYAFHSWGRHLVHFLRLKGFDEPFSQRTHQRLDGLEPAGMTRMGAAIRHASQLMAHEKHHSHRVILLLSDGFAYDDQYEGRHAEADTARALSDAQASGIGCVCLNIGSNQDDEILKCLYGPSAYLRCADTHHAAPALRRLMRGAIVNASIQSAQRKRHLAA